MLVKSHHTIEKFVKYGRALSKPRTLLAPKKYIFVLSHMRARSTLLSHILGSHPEICGHRELHLSYERRIDLLKMRVALVANDDFHASRFLLDKLLYNQQLIEMGVFNRNQVFIIILIRPPNATLKSMERMHREHFENKNTSHLHEYYQKRISRLAKIGPELESGYFFIDSDDLVKDSKNCLESLSKYLCLSTPLESDYQTFKDTGTFGLGDPGKNIHAGKILSEQGERNSIIEGPLETAYDIVFEDCKRRLSKFAVNK